MVFPRDERECADLKYTNAGFAFSQRLEARTDADLARNARVRFADGAASP